MNLIDRRTLYRSLLTGSECIHPASVFDPISARIAEDLGFEVGMLAGSIASATVLGAPDLILLTLTEFAQQVHRICRASTISLMVDADHGYGNAINVKRTVEELETAGVAALTIEDTVLPKSFGNPEGKQLTSLEEGIGKMKAALTARQDPTLVIAGRTSAITFAGIDETIRRAKAYERVGIDALFLAGATTRKEIEAIHAEVKLPLMLGSTPEELTDSTFLANNGVRIALRGHLPFQASVKAVYDTLKAQRECAPEDALSPYLASSSLMAQVTRQSDYNHSLQEYLT